MTLMFLLEMNHGPGIFYFYTFWHYLVAPYGWKMFYVYFITHCHPFFLHGYEWC